MNVFLRVCLVFSVADRLVGGLRINGEEERVGLDRLEHVVDAHPEFGMPSGEELVPSREPATETVG